MGGLVGAIDGSNRFRLGHLWHKMQVQPSTQHHHSRLGHNNINNSSSNNIIIIIIIIIINNSNNTKKSMYLSTDSKVQPTSVLSVVSACSGCGV